MGIKERRVREREEMRRGILDAAHEIATIEGWQAVTIRRVAEKIEYSPPTIYEYFNSKEQIVIELMREGFRQMLANMRAARDAHADPVDAAVAMGKAYWEFALAHPEMHLGMQGETAFEACIGRAYVPGLKEVHGQHPSPPPRHRPFEEVHTPEDWRGLFQSRSPKVPEGEPFPEAHEIFVTVRDALERAVGGRHHDLEDLSWKVVIVWGSMHGLVSLAMAGLILNGRTEGARLVEKMLRDLLTVWRVEAQDVKH